jgi:tyrosine-protein kinase Etk/Wzc
MKETEARPRTARADRTLLEGFLHYVAILLRYRWLIICVTGAVALGAVAFSIASLLLPPDKSPLPNVFTAQATILVQRGSQGALASSILSSLGIEPGAATVAPGFDNGSLLSMVLQSRTFMDKIIEEYDIVQRYHIHERVRSESRALLQSKTTISYDRNTASIVIAFKDTDAVFARDVTNRMVSLLNEWYARNMGSSNVQQKKLLEEKVKEVKAEIDSLEKRLKALQNRYGVLSAQELGTSQASALAELRSQLILKEIDIKNYATFSAIEDPKLQQLREERQNILDLINRFQTSVPSVQESSQGPTNLAEVQMSFNNLAVELDVQRKIYNTLTHQYEVLKLTSEPEEAFQVLELAEVPDAKSGPRRLLIVVQATVIGFAAAIALAFLLHNLSQLRARSQKTSVSKADAT